MKTLTKLLLLALTGITIESPKIGTSLRSALFFLICTFPCFAQWQKTQITANSDVLSMYTTGTKLYIGAWGATVYLSTDNGTSFSVANTGLPSSVNCFASDGTSIYAGTSGDGIYAYGGTTWTTINTTATDGNIVYALGANNGNIYAGMVGNGVFLSSNKGTAWSDISTGLGGVFDINAFVFNGTTIFLCTDQGGNTTNPSGVYRYNGTSWTAVNTGLPNANATNVSSLIVKGGTLFAGTPAGIFSSADNGNSWQAVNNGLTNLYVMSLAANGNAVFAATYGGGVFMTTDNGANWTAVNTGLPTNLNAKILAVNNSMLFVAIDKGGVWRRALSNMGVQIGINEHTFSLQDIFFYPDADNTLSIETPSPQKQLDISIYNIIGQVVYSSQWMNFSGKHSINLNKFPKGMYLLHLIQEEGMMAKKIMIQ